MVSELWSENKAKGTDGQIDAWRMDGRTEGHSKFQTVQRNTLLLFCGGACYFFVAGHKRHAFKTSDIPNTSAVQSYLWLFTVP